MKHNPGKPVLHKTIFRVDMVPSLEYYGEYLNAVQRLRKDRFEHWQSPEHGQIILHNYTQRMSVNITPNTIVFDADNSDLAIVDGMISPVVDFIDELTPAEVKRIGLRRIYIVPVQMEFYSLVEVFNVKYLNQDPELKSIVGTITDSIYRVYTADGPTKLNYMVGPTHSAEMQRNLMFNASLHLDPRTANLDLKAVFDKYPAIGLHVDLDAVVLESGYTSEGILEFYNQQSKIIEDKSSRIASYTLGTSL